MHGGWAIDTQREGAMSNARSRPLLNRGLPRDTARKESKSSPMAFPPADSSETHKILKKNIGDGHVHEVSKTPWYLFNIYP